MSTPAPSTRRRRLLAWAAAWAVLTIASTVAHRLTWMREDPAWIAGDDSWTGKVAGNLTVIPTAPGWLVMGRLAGGLNGRSVPFALGANAIGWTPWLAGAWWVMRRRRRWIDSGRLIRRPPVSTEALTAAGASRRRLIADATGFSLAAAAGAGYGHATIVAPWQLRVRSFEVAIRDLPAGLDGLVIAQVGDTHFGPRVPAEHVREAVRLTMGINADLIGLVGDYIHNGPEYAKAGIEMLRPLTQTGRCVAVLGNHDNYLEAGPLVTKALREAGAHLLDNSAVFLTSDRRIVARRPDGPCLAVAGVADFITQESIPNLALGGIDPATPRLVLSHNPDVAEHHQLWNQSTGQQWHRVDLMLCGHTHGGQVRLPLIGLPMVASNHGREYASGLNQGPVCPVITTNGVGISVVPIRIGVPPEVVRVVLRKG